MTEPRRTGLQTTFGFFLGLMVTAFVGVGIYTFYPSPEEAFRDRLAPLNRQQQEIRNSRAPDALTPEERARIQSIQNEIDGLQDALRAASQTWGRRTSIVLIALATLAMAISLVRAVQLPVISDGLLLGGVFTMVYGIGWIIATDTSTARFFVMTVALAITLGLGYLRFVRGGAHVPAHGPAGAPSAEGAGELERRVHALEQRMARAAGALGYEGEQRKDT